MVKDFVFFGESGLTSTSANHVANLAKEYIQNLESVVNGVELTNISVKLLDSDNDNIINLGMSVNDMLKLPESLDAICKAKSLIAWLREAIKTKEALLGDLYATSITEWIRENHISLPEQPVEEHILTEKEYYSSLPIKERNRYYQLETQSAVLGKYIHPDGPFSIARKTAEQAARTPHKIEGSGRDTLIYSYSPSVSSQEVDAMFFDLQKKYREAQAQLNSMKHECEVAISKSTNEVNTTRAIQLEAYNNAFDMQSARFKEWKERKIQEYSNLKIVIPDSLKEIYTKINSLGR